MPPLLPPRTPAPPSSAAVLWLCATIAALAAFAAGVGLFWEGEGTPVGFETARGEAVALYGRGLYRYDALFNAAGSRGTDALTLWLGLPLLAVSTALYWRGSLRGTLLLAGTLGYFLYVYASYALGAVTYNPLFLVYVALFAASLWAFGLVFRGVDLRRLAAGRLPRRGPAAFMLASGLVTLGVWGAPLVAALVRGELPVRLGPASTMLTEALDLATITPAAFLAGMLILRGDPRGYLVAASLLVLEVLLAPMIALQTASQVAAGVAFRPAEIVGPMVGFSALGLLALWVLVALLQGAGPPAAPRTAERSPSRWQAPAAQRRALSLQ